MLNRYLSRWIVAWNWSKTLLRPASDNSSVNASLEAKMHSWTEISSLMDQRVCINAGKTLLEALRQNNHKSLTITYHTILIKFLFTNYSFNCKKFIFEPVQKNKQRLNPSTTALKSLKFHVDTTRSFYCESHFSVIRIYLSNLSNCFILKVSKMLKRTKEISFKLNVRQLPEIWQSESPIDANSVNKFKKLQRIPELITYHEIIVRKTGNLYIRNILFSLTCHSKVIYSKILTIIIYIYHFLVIIKNRRTFILSQSFSKQYKSTRIFSHKIMNKAILKSFFSNKINTHSAIISSKSYNKKNNNINKLFYVHNSCFNLHLIRLLSYVIFPTYNGNSCLYSISNTSMRMKSNQFSLSMMKFYVYRPNTNVKERCENLVIPFKSLQKTLKPSKCFINIVYEKLYKNVQIILNKNSFHNIHFHSTTSARRTLMRTGENNNG